MRQLNELVALGNRAASGGAVQQAIDAEIARVLASAHQLPLPMLRSIGRTVASPARMATLSERCLERFFETTALPNGTPWTVRCAFERVGY